MNNFNFLHGHDPAPRPRDELLYEFVAAELANSMIKQGLWAKALSDSNWNQPSAKALYVKMRVAQLRGEILAESRQRMAALSDPVREAREFGLTEEEVEYLGKPIKAVRHVEKFRITKDKLAEAIGRGKIRAVLCNEVLWVQDRAIG
ncbi:MULTISPECIES: hypothetical protein [Cupriavidus]|nr:MULTISPECIES: hypothetical protein [Cupriavidus]MCO4865600.1 hypothetical protein [Cupriavidus sp. WGlv3]MCO4893320.1 hypothetical protein [Cupriavidus sp. WGtm5]ULX56037.1 hypothetical protein A9P79_29130 [Cupriavidus taiwanensis]CAP63725.1 conserved hypothetical protein [Cupriavidus taiwanensis LMG 19424]SOY75747.1 conserved hypothetical protein [Cupriavidus taiwanensis]